MNNHQPNNVSQTAHYE